MFLITGGIGLLGCIIGIILLIISYVKNKPFVLPMIVFLLCFIILGASIVLQARGGLDFGPFRTDAPEDVQQEDADGGSAAQPEDVPPQGEAARVPLDGLCSLIDIALTGNFPGKSVTHDGASVTVNVWQDGLTEQSAVSDAGVWESAKNTLTELAGSLRALMDACGPENTALTLNLLDAQNQETVLLSFLDSSVTYDIAEEPAPTAAPSTPNREPASSTETTVRPEPSEEPSAGPEPSEEPNDTAGDEEQSAGTSPQLPPTNGGNATEDGDSGVSSGPQLPPD